jgi:hypothetical protein
MGTMTTGTIVEDRRVSTPLSCGVANPGFYYLRQWAGGDGSRSEQHSYDCQVISRLDNPITWKFPPSTGLPDVFTGTVPSCFGGFPDEVPLWDPNDEFKLVDKALGEFKGHDFNAAVNLGELKESVSMIASTARSLAQAYVSLKRANVPGALKALGMKPKTSIVRDVQHNLRDSAASAWLGLTYGWSPLLGAVDDAAKAAAHHLRPRRVRITARRKIKGPSEIRGGAGFLADAVSDRSVNLIWLIEEEAKFSALEEFGFMSPSLVAWELMPFSFVADWFLPIGNFLSARSTLSSLKGTYIRTERTKRIISVSPQMADTGYQILSGSFWESTTQVHRTVGSISSMPLPGPQLKDPLSLSHAVSAISLLQTVFLSRRT